MWIETSSCNIWQPVGYNSFASNGECGLKHCLRLPENHITPNSFASNGECGLKQQVADALDVYEEIHSPAMANVD